VAGSAGGRTALATSQGGPGGKKLLAAPASMTAGMAVRGRRPRRRGQSAWVGARAAGSSSSSSSRSGGAVAKRAFQQGPVPVGGACGRASAVEHTRCQRPTLAAANTDGAMPAAVSRLGRRRCRPGLRTPALRAVGCGSALKRLADTCTRFSAQPGRSWPPPVPPT
jgi:hypothetical protein